MVNRRSDNRFSGARNLPLNRSLRGLVGGRDRSDFYKFTAANRLDFSLAVSGLRSNVNVKLFNSNRQPIAISRLPGNRAEQISATLDSGTFFLQVQLAGGRRNTFYNLRTSAIPSPTPTPTPIPTPIPTPTPTPVADNTLGAATDLGVLTGTLTRSEFVGPEDTVDFYKFTLNDIANLQVRLNTVTAGAGIELIRDANGNGLVDTGEVLDSDRSVSGNALADFTEELPSGTYFFRVTNSNTTSTQYSLNLIPTFFGGNISPDPGSTLPTARDLGVFSGNFTAKEYVGPVDPADIYRITLNDLSKLDITRTGPSREPKVKLIRDNNNNGLIDSGEVFNDDQFGILSNRATIDLPVGTYFILVEPDINSSFPTSYQMDLVVTPYGGNGLPDPGNSLPTARDLGNLSGTTSFKEYVGPLLDPNDIYRFTLNDLSKLQITRTGPSRDPKVKLIRDSNNNGLIDSGEIFNDNQFAITTDSATVDLPVGTYFILVEPGGVLVDLPTVYQMDLVVTPYGGNDLPDPGNSLPTARDLGNLSGTTSFKEYVGLLLDPNDFYRFTVGGPTNLQARLTTSDDDLNLNLIQDANNNGLIDADEILRSGITGLTRDLQAGTYFLRVEPRFSGGNRSANYELTLVTA